MRASYCCITTALTPARHHPRPPGRWDGAVPTTVPDGRARLPLNLGHFVELWEASVPATDSDSEPVRLAGGGHDRRRVDRC
jgi:hypothetical protein